MGEGAAVVRAKDKEPDSVGAILAQGISDGDEVAQRLAHFLAAKLKQSVVQPVADKGFDSRKTFRLGDFVLMVGEDEVLTAAVDVNGLSQVL